MFTSFENPPVLDPAALPNRAVAPEGVVKVEATLIFDDGAVMMNVFFRQDDSNVFSDEAAAIPLAEKSRDSSTPVLNLGSFFPEAKEHKVGEARIMAADQARVMENKCAHDFNATDALDARLKGEDSLGEEEKSTASPRFKQDDTVSFTSADGTAAAGTVRVVDAGGAWGIDEHSYDILVEDGTPHPTQAHPRECRFRRSAPSGAGIPAGRSPGTGFRGRGAPCRRCSLARRDRRKRQEGGARILDMILLVAWAAPL